MNLIPTELRELLDYLAASHIPEGGRWQEWQVEAISGGANNRIFHARGPAGDLAVKFTLRDRRFRAEREYAALQALGEAGLQIAPGPLILDTKRCSLPVVVQEWLPGPVSSNPPEEEAAWEALLEHFKAIHSITPERTSVPLRKALVNFSSARQGVQVVNHMADLLPPEGRPAGLEEMVRRFNTACFPSWQSPALTLCRTDPAPLNFIRRPGGWASVDWENSGWGDPAYYDILYLNNLRIISASFRTTRKTLLMIKWNRPERSRPS
jgi:aminoglycoside phosphotransferase (APT) family kinase protein